MCLDWNCHVPISSGIRLSSGFEGASELSAGGASAQMICMATGNEADYTNDLLTSRMLYHHIDLSPKNIVPDLDLITSGGRSITKIQCASSKIYCTLPNAQEKADHVIAGRL